MSQFNQVKGGDCRVLLYPESSLKTLASPVQAVEIPFISESLTAKPSKQTKATVRGKRGPGRPFRGMWQFGGGLSVPANTHLIPHLVTALCGAATKTEPAGLTLDAGDAVDQGEGYVGLPCAAHGFEIDAVVSVSGTTSYDGTYRVEQGSTADLLVIYAGTYAAETFGGTEAVQRGRVVKLDAGGAAVNKGGGKVGLPAAGHGFFAGERVTVAGTTNYNAAYTLDEDTSRNEMVVTASYVTETFAGDETVAAKFYKRAWDLPKVQPSRMAEVEFGFDSGAADNPVDRHYGAKVGKLAFNYGDDGQLTLDFEISQSKYQQAAAVLASDAAIAVLPDCDFGMFEVAVYLDGARLGEVEKGSLDLGLNLERKAAVGQRGEYGKVTEGDPALSASLDCFLEDDTLLAKARADTTVEFAIAFFGARGEEFWITYPEAELNTDGPQISGKGGINVTFEVMGFVDQADAAVQFAYFHQVPSILGE